MMQMFFFSISGFDSVSRAHFVQNQVRDSFNSFRLVTLSLGDEYVGIFGNYCHNSPNWTYLYDADVFLQFRVLIRILELICVPNPSRVSINSFRLDTVSLGDEYVVVVGMSCYNSINWAWLYDVDVYFQFRVLIRFLELISIQNQFSNSFNSFRLDTLSLGDEDVWILGK